LGAGVTCGRCPLSLLLGLKSERTYVILRIDYSYINCVKNGTQLAESAISYSLFIVLLTVTDARSERRGSVKRNASCSRKFILYVDLFQTDEAIYCIDFVGIVHNLYDFSLRADTNIESVAVAQNI
jgi:hypothetical protein